MSSQKKQQNMSLPSKTASQPASSSIRVAHEFLNHMRDRPPLLPAYRTTHNQPPPSPRGALVAVFVISIVLAVDIGYGIHLCFSGPTLNSTPFNLPLELSPVFGAQVLLSIGLLCAFWALSRSMDEARAAGNVAGEVDCTYNEASGRYEAGDDGQGTLSCAPALLTATIVQALLATVLVPVFWGRIRLEHVLGWFFFCFWVAFMADLFVLGFGKVLVDFLERRLTTGVHDRRGDGYRRVPVLPQER